jgi:iron complex outermembrane receptor protein
MKRMVLSVLLCGATATAIGQTATSDKDNAGSTDLQEIVVTGTSIRGAPPIGSQLITLDSAAIVATGVTNTADLLATVPVLSSFNTAPQGGAINSGTSGGTPPSLHGLPPAATLTMIDGHRLVGDSPLNTYPDPSWIPPGAIERVEVVADGGSAIYGSDAVAGVINIILKKDYDGAETTASYGGASQYNFANIGQVIGKTWNGGSAMVSLNYASNSDLPNSARSFYTADLAPYGGTDFRSTSCSPANVMIGSATYASPNLYPGALTRCDQNLNSDIINQNRRYGFIATARQDLGDRVHLFFDAKYTDDLEQEATSSNVVSNTTINNTNPFFVAPPGTNATSETILYNTGNLGAQSDVYTAKSGMLDFGAAIDVTRSWQITTDFDYGWSNSSALNPSYNGTALAAAVAGTTTATALDPFGSNTNPALAASILDYPTYYDTQQKLYDLNVKGDGAVVALPGGDVKLAVGGAFRKETYAALNETGVPTEEGFSQASVSTFRNVGSAYTELFVPVFGPANAMPFLNRLDLSAAVRYDHYSDFGSTTNPKYGITWSPMDGLSFRASYGHSFHAPQLSDLDAVDTRAILSPNNTGLVPPGSPPLNTIILAGGNPNLLPETARTASFGVDFAPEALPGFKASVGYFMVRYVNQINVPPLNEQVFLDPTLFSRFVVENPSAAQLAAALNNVRQTWSGPLPTIQQILTFTRNNIGATDVDGWDFDFHYRSQLSAGALSFGLGGSYLTEYETQQAGGAPFVDNLTSGQSYVNQVGIVPLHLRATVGWEAGPLTSQLAFNYTGHYKFGYVDTVGASSVQDVRSFPTLDWFGAYTLPPGGLGGNVTVALNVYNILNETPPLLLETGGFSAQTANPIGRMFMVTLKKRW